MSQSVLVTGGAGFIGANVARGLLRRGATVRIIDNLCSGYAANLPDGAELVVGDVTDAGAVYRAARGVDVILHLAASVGNKRSIDDPVMDATVNVLGTINVLEAARTHGIRKVVISSSAGIFGELKHLPIREDHPAEPDTPYGASKLCAEKQGLAYAKLYPIEVVCLRYFNVFGRLQRFDAYGNVIPMFVFQMLRGEPLTIHGDGEQTRDFINVADVAEANIRAGEIAGVSGAFNIGSASRITINRLVEILKDVSGLDPVVRRGPPRPGDVRDSLADITAARNAFGFEPSTAIEDGLASYWAWAAEEFGKAAVPALAAPARVGGAA